MTFCIIIILRDIQLTNVVIRIRGNLEFYDDKQISHLIYLTVGYVHNLGLSQRPLKPQQKATLTFNPSDAKEAMRGVFLTTIVEESHSLEEQRCLLGCYYLMSL